MSMVHGAGALVVPSRTMERMGSAAQRPLRVLTFTTIFPNAAQPRHGLFVRERVRALAGLADVHVMAPVPAAPPLAGLPARFYRCRDVSPAEHDSGYTISHPRFVAVPGVLKTADPLAMAACCWPAVARHRRRFPFDVIDAHWACPDGVAAALLARAMNVPFSVTVRGDDLNVFAREVGRGGAIRWALRRAAAVIAVSEDLARRAIMLGARPERVAVVGNGVDAERFSPVPRDDARRRLGLAVDGRLLLSVGRLHASKGFPILVDALSRMPAGGQDVRLAIVGDPDDEADAVPAIQQAIARHGLERRVQLVGGQPQDRLALWYSAADVFCLATEREGSANVLLEAQACGVPLVTTDVGGNRDTVVDERYGLLAHRSADAFAVVLADALERPWDRVAIRARAKSRGWDAVAHQCHAILRGLAREEVAA